MAEKPSDERPTDLKKQAKLPFECLQSSVSCPCTPYGSLSHLWKAAEQYKFVQVHVNPHLGILGCTSQYVLSRL